MTNEDAERNTGAARVGEILGTVFAVACWLMILYPISQRL